MVGATIGRKDAANSKPRRTVAVANKHRENGPGLATMKYVEFSISTSGRWYSDLLGNNPDLRLVSDHVCLLPQGLIVSRLEIMGARDSDVETVLETIRGLKKTQHWVLAREKDRIRLLVVGPSKYGLTAGVLRAGGVLVHPIVAHNRRQYFSVLAPARALEKIRNQPRFTDFKLHVIHREPSSLKQLPEMPDLIDDLNEELTEKQIEILFAAFRGNYFAWPHASTIADLAKGAGISQATFHEHLQKATARVMSRVLTRVARRRGIGPVRGGPS